MSPQRLKVQVASWVLIALAAGLIPACGGGDSGDAAPPPFIITDVFPPHLGGNVALQPIFYIRFSRSLNPATANNTTIKLTTITPVSDVACTFTYEDCHKEVRFTPNAALAASTTYRVFILTGITDALGNPYAGNIYFDVTTGAFTDNIRPGAGVALSANTATLTSLLVTWSASTEVAAGYDIFRSTESGCFDFAAAPYRTQSAGLTSKVVDVLESDTTYYFVVRAHDAEGNVSTNETEVSGKTLTSFVGDVWPIVAVNCSGCHTSGAGSAVMLMSTAPITYTNWYDVAIVCNEIGNTIPVTAKRVKPGGGAAAVGDSFVYNKVWSKANNPLAVWCGSPMPFTGAALTAPQIQTFYDWIFEGAANN